jgi:transcription factor 1
MTSTLRSFNPHLVEHFTKTNIPKVQYGFRNIVRPLVCQEILNKLELKRKYPNSQKTLDILDVFPGYGLFSTMVNYELKPRNHIVIDNNAIIARIWHDRIEYLKTTTGNKENFRLYKQDGYLWETYDNLIKRDKLLNPRVVPRTQIHDELLVVANLTTSKFGELLLAQWLMCCAYGNWLQKYGRVRILCFASEQTGQKFTSQERFHKRNKTGVKRDTFTDTRIVAITEAENVSEPDGTGYDPTCLVRDQPLVIPKKSLLPSTGAITLLEIEPKNIDLDNINVDLYEYFLRIFMFRRASTVIEALKHVGPGADADLAPKLNPDLLTKTVRDLTVEETLTVFDVFYKWPFRPSYEETIEITEFEDRRF